MAPRISASTFWASSADSAVTSSWWCSPPSWSYSQSSTAPSGTKGSIESKSENDAWRAKGCCPATKGSRARSIRRCPSPRSDRGQTGRTREKGSIGAVMRERIRGSPSQPHPQRGSAPRPRIPPQACPTLGIKASTDVVVNSAPPHPRRPVSAGPPARGGRFLGCGNGSSRHPRDRRLRRTLTRCRVPAAGDRLYPPPTDGQTVGGT